MKVEDLEFVHHHAIAHGNIIGFVTVILTVGAGPVIVKSTGGLARFLQITLYRTKIISRLTY